TPTPEAPATPKGGAETQARMLAELRAAVAGDAACVALLDARDAGDGPGDDELAARIGVTREELENAWRRLRYAAGRLGREQGMRRRVTLEPSADARALAAGGIDLEATRV